MNPWILNFWYFIFHFNFWTRLTLSCLSKLLMNAAFGYIWILSPRQRKANSEKHSKLRRVSILIPWYDNITWHNGENWTMTATTGLQLVQQNFVDSYRPPRPQRWYINTSWTHPHRPGKFKMCGANGGRIREIEGTFQTEFWPGNQVMACHIPEGLSIRSEAWNFSPCAHVWSASCWSDSSRHCKCIDVVPRIIIQLWCPSKMVCKYIYIYHVYISCI